MQSCKISSKNHNMNKNILNINTHNAFLNTEIIITNSGDKVDLLDLSTGVKYELNNQLKLHLKAGHHHFICKELNEELFVDIEDAIKLGGGDIKSGSSFVSDDSPWLFVTMEDRIYGHNLQTNEEFIEYSLTPDKISWICDDFFLFQTQNDFTIISMHDRKMIFHFSNLIYINAHFVVYSENDDKDFRIFNYRDNCTFFMFEGQQYSITKNGIGEDILFYINDNYVKYINLETGEVNTINELPYGKGIWHIHGNLINTVHSYKLYDKWLIIGNLFIDLLKKESCGLIPIPENCKVIEVLGHVVENGCEARANLFRSMACDLLDKFEDISCNISCARIIKVLEEEGYIKVWLIITTYKIYKNYCKKDLRYFKVKLGDKYIIETDIQNFYSDIRYENKGEERFLIDSEEGELLAFSFSKNRYLTKSGSEVHYYERGKCKTILKELFDTTKYNNAFFSSDGKTVVINDDKGKLSTFGLESFLLDSFSIEGIASFKKNAYNGYKPEILINNSSVQKPVWIDPVSLSIIDPNEFANLEYVSIDNTWIAKSRMDTIYYNRLTNLNITNEDYLRLCELYNIKWNSSDNDKSFIVERRKKLYLENKKDLESFIREINMDKFKGEQLDNIVNDAMQRFLNQEYDFVSLFVEHRDYLVYQNIHDKRIRHVLIGRNVWFLNYVSFSYDSRYMAFGAKLRSDKFRQSEEGVFVLYDLIEEKKVCQIDKDRNLFAVWMTVFSRLGDVAFYDSHANAFVVTATSDYTECTEILGKSLLCFSPSGKYIAFSEQGYISYKYCPNSWGHQPSGKIFICSIHDLLCPLVTFNDFGKCIKGISPFSRANSVAIAAFSQDESRLLAVGEDGVIVVRNLKNLS